jgi:Mrp family chromosome partitioning ATPase
VFSVRTEKLKTSWGKKAGGFSSSVKDDLCLREVRCPNAMKRTGGDWAESVTVNQVWEQAMQTVAVFALKGGVGKSAITIFLADFLSSVFDQ